MNRLKEFTDRYTESAILSAVRLKRYWIARGFSEAEATTKAANQAVGMMKAGNWARSKVLIIEIEEMCRALKKRIGFDCMLCSFMPCLDLYRKDEIRGEEAGGELHILNLSLSSPIGSAIYHNSGLLLGSLEDILVDLVKENEIFFKKKYLHIFLWHSLRDLKASIFIAFCGRYRQALMTLRSALEIVFAGVYLQSLEDEGKKDKLEKEWQRWWKKKSSLFSEGLKVVSERRLLNQQEVGKLYGVLSKAVHKLVRDEWELIINKDKNPSRPSSAFYNEEFIQDWFDKLIQVVRIIKDILSGVIAEHQKKIESMDFADRIIQEIQSDRKNRLAFVDCPRLHINSYNVQKT